MVKSKPRLHGCDCLCMINRLTSGHRLEFMLRKSIQKRLSNQKQRHPSMRIEALLESTEKLVVDGLCIAGCNENVIGNVDLFCNDCLQNQQCHSPTYRIPVNQEHHSVSNFTDDQDIEQELGLDAFFTDLKNIKVHDGICAC